MWIHSDTIMQQNILIIGGLLALWIERIFRVCVTWPRSFLLITTSSYQSLFWLLIPLSSALNYNQQHMIISGMQKGAAMPNFFRNHTKVGSL
jgi:hypothetical protein